MASYLATLNLTVSSSPIQGIFHVNSSTTTSYYITIDGKNYAVSATPSNDTYINCTTTYNTTDINYTLTTGSITAITEGTLCYLTLNDKYLHSDGNFYDDIETEHSLYSIISPVEDANAAINMFASTYTIKDADIKLFENELNQNKLEAISLILENKINITNTSSPTTTTINIKSET